MKKIRELLNENIDSAQAIAQQIVDNWRLGLHLEKVDVIRKKAKKSVAKQCYRNAFDYVTSHPGSSYVLGIYMVYGSVPVEHAWVHDGNSYIDITVDNALEGDLYYKAIEIPGDKLLQMVLDDNGEMIDFYRLSRHKRKAEKNGKGLLEGDIVSFAEKKAQKDDAERAKKSSELKSKLQKFAKELPMELANQQESEKKVIEWKKDARLRYNREFKRLIGLKIARLLKEYNEYAYIPNVIMWSTSDEPDDTIQYAYDLAREYRDQIIPMIRRHLKELDDKIDEVKTWKVPAVQYVTGILSNGRYDLTGPLDWFEKLKN